MTRRIVTTLIDDMDGSVATETVGFAIDGQKYEIDLSEENAAKLRSDFEAYMAVAKRTTPSRRTRTTLSTRLDDPREVRNWAKANGFKVGSRGAIPKEVHEAYEKSHQG